MRSAVGRFVPGMPLVVRQRMASVSARMALDDLPEDLGVLRAQAGGGVPHVHVQDAGAGPPRGDALGGDLAPA